MRSWLRSICLAAAGFGCAGLALCGGSCVIAPPPELPPLVQRPPRILHDSVVPPEGVPLPFWPGPPSATGPGVLLVPLVVEDPPYDYRVFVDYPQTIDPLGPLAPPPQAVDGGTVLSISIDPDEPNHPIDLRGCHVIRVVVAHSFLSNNTPDSLGGDSVSWPYYPSASAPFTCAFIDAGPALLDGFVEALPVAPLSEGGDP